MIKNPMPEKVKRDGSFEDTMMLLEMIKEKQQKENKQMKARFFLNFLKICHSANASYTKM